jgi:hypothetical protein
MAHEPDILWSRRLRFLWIVSLSLFFFSLVGGGVLFGATGWWIAAFFVNEAQASDATLVEITVFIFTAGENHFQRWQCLVHVGTSRCPSV